MLNLLPAYLNIPKERVEEVCIRATPNGKFYGHIIYVDREMRLAVASFTCQNARSSFLEGVVVRDTEDIVSYYSNRYNPETNGEAIDSLVAELESRAEEHLRILI